MRRTIAIILFLLFGFSFYAETGYDGLEWHRRRDLIQEPEDALVYKAKDGSLEVITVLSAALGHSTVKSYIFTENKLEGVVYYIYATELEELQNRLSDKKKIYETHSGINIYEEYKKADIETPEWAQDEALESVFITKVLYILAFGNCSEIEYKGYKSVPLNKKDPADLYIYNYNDDTRIYILLDTKTNIGFVVYLPYYKDF